MRKRPPQSIPARHKLASFIVGISTCLILIGGLLLITNATSLTDEGLKEFDYGITILLWGLGLGVLAQLVFAENNE